VSDADPGTFRLGVNYWPAEATDDELLPFLAAITRWLAGGAPILFEEFGLPTGRRGPAESPLLYNTARDMT